MNSSIKQQKKLTETQTTYFQQLLQFLVDSPTPFHATANLLQQFLDAGFTQLDEADDWQAVLESTASTRYVITRNDSSLIAINLGTTRQSLVETGFRIVAAHTDSPCLKIKPNAQLSDKNYLQTAAEVYGGVLLNPWFDRDLSLAGRVSYLDDKGELKHTLVNFKRPIAVIPSLAIHLDREANTSRSINAQTDINPIWFTNNQMDKEEPDFSLLLLAQLNHQHNKANAKQILSYELSFYDTQEASLLGMDSDFMVGARLDNLLSCFIAAHSLLTSNQLSPAMVIFSDHEEVGSTSIAGANGNFLTSVLRRLLQKEENYYRCMGQSFLISADNAHALHPNYKDKHDPLHGPIINQGIVIKNNANQRYASNSIGQAFIKQLAEQVKIPLQQFVIRNDMSCGSTIGPIVANQTGINTLDLGLPTFAMHSIRETAGVADALNLHKLLIAYFNHA